MRYVLVTLLFVSFSAFAARPATEKELGYLKSAMEGRLKDPYSAKLRNVTVGSLDKTGMLPACGMVNSKNSFGAYAGEEPFYGMVVPDKKVAIIIGVGSEAVVTMCESEGLM